MRIAAAQAHPAWGDPTTTAGIITNWIEAAAEDGVLGTPAVADARSIR